MRLIDADKLLIALLSPEMRVTKQLIEEAPTIDAEPVKHGEWIKTDVCENQFKCSECGRTVTTNTSIVDPADFEFYCYNCGARMDGGENE